MPMQERLKALAEAARREISEAGEPAQVEALRVRYLGKKGELSQILGGMGKLPPDERRTLGAVANEVKADLEALLAQAVARAEDSALEAQLQGPGVDITLPGRGLRPGRRHPVSRTLEDVVRTFARLGFDVAEGPELELDFFNFEALNLPKDHPARDMQDTFYAQPESLGLAQPPESPVLLRTHTSPVQVRTMLKTPPPLRIVAPGRVYRRDSDLTHTPMFHQVEGLLVDKDVSFAELKGTLDAFVKAFFGVGHQDALPALVLPLHRALGGGGHQLHLLRRQGLPGVQADRMAGGPGLRDGASQRLPRQRLRPGGGHRLRLRSGDRAPGDAAPSHRRSADDVRERRALPGAVLTWISRSSG